MGKTDITKEMELKLWKHTQKTGTFGCFEVTIGWYGRERVDYITYDTKGIWRCYEIKTSKDDFYSDAKVTFIGDYNYYVMPRELYDEVKEEIPKHVGVFVEGSRSLASVKRASKQEVIIPKNVLKDSLIRSLYREKEKSMIMGKTNRIEELERELRKSNKELRNIHNQYSELCEKLYSKYGVSWRDNLYK